MSTAGERYAAALANGNAAEIDAALADLREEQRRANTEAIEQGARENPARAQTAGAYEGERVRRVSAPPLRLVSLDEYVTRPSVSWLVRDLIPAESIVVMFGAPKSGKTHVAADLSMHAAHGMHWHGHNITRPLRVAYLAGEGHMGLRVRFHVWRRHHEAEMRGAMAVLPQSLWLAERVSDVIAALGEYRPDVVVCDTLNAYFGAGDENSTKDMTAFVAAVRAIRDAVHCSVLVIHHTGLADSTRERGSGVLRGAADVIVQVARDASGSRGVGVQVIDARDMEPWAEPLSLRLEQAETDWQDDEGRPLTACVVLSSEVPVSIPGRTAKLGTAQSTVLAVARELAAQRRNGSPDVTLYRHEVSTVAQQRGISRQSVSSAWQPLHNRGFIKLIEPGSLSVRVSGLS